jgi:DNA-binding NtrC family response regulator
MPKILIVDDMANVRKSLSILLRKNGYLVDEAESGMEALALLRVNKYDLVVTDLKMEPIDGIAVLKEIKSSSAKTQVILLTAHGTVENSVQAMKLGANDYLTKPYNIADMLDAVRKALENIRASDEQANIVSSIEGQFGTIIGKSEAMDHVFNLIVQVAKTDCTVIISGDSGTGKELVARAIHAQSNRKNKPFIGINCGALTDNILESELFGHTRGSFTGAHRDRKGLFQNAENGTIFLDEIGDISQQLQVKLLRFLQESEIRPVGSDTLINVDVRIIAASNKNLEEEVQKGNFREDLYYRLNVIPINLPNLIQRKEDIPLLVNYFIKKYARKLGRPVPHISKNAFEALNAHNWPGNVRELENMMERNLALVRKEVINKEDLIFNNVFHEKSLTQKIYDENLTLAAAEKELILHCFDDNSGNHRETARKLGISTTTLWRKLKTYQLEVA